MTFSIINCGPKPVSRGYSSSQHFDIDVRDASSSKVWRWSHDMVFAQVITQKTFEPREVVTFGVAWDQLTSSGEQVAPGIYELYAYDVGCRRMPVSQCDLSARLAIEILPPPQ